MPAKYDARADAFAEPGKSWKKTKAALLLCRLTSTASAPVGERAITAVQGVPQLVAGTAGLLCVQRSTPKPSV
jgi:hypothetical protein